MPGQPVPENGRKYRSHNQPACLPCRKRKSRCKEKSPLEPCVMCEVHGTTCVWPELEAVAVSQEHTSTEPPRKRVRHYARNASSPVAPHAAATRSGANAQSPIAQGFSPHSMMNRSVPRNASEMPQTGLQDPGTLSDTDDHNVHVVAPVMANDIEILETYLSNGAVDQRRPKAQTTPGRQSRPVIFTTVSKKPLGTRQYQSLASSKCELIEKLLEPHAQDILERYLERANQCLPVFDRSQFFDMYVSRRDKISPALLANLYANAMTYWIKTSPTPMHAPDSRYIWVQAEEALQSEIFLSPGTSTVIALILNTSGRPSTSPFNNGGMIGTAVGLAHALGLNRDPTTWNISEQEKDMRVRIWWQLMVQDRWCSWSYGTPPQIHSTQYDVPLPTLRTVCKSNAPVEQSAAAIALALLSLSEVLGVLLEDVYRLKEPRGSSAHCICRESSISLANHLSSWQSSLHGPVEEVVRHGTQMHIPGAANLRLSFLATQLLLRRIQLDLNESSTDAGDGSQTAYHHFQALQAAEDIAWFVQSLDEQQVRGFWLGHNGATLTSAQSFLLRSALNSTSLKDFARGKAILDKAIKMMEVLRSLQMKYNWDLADNCIAQYGPSIDSLAEMMADDTGQELQNPQKPITNTLPDMEDMLAQLPDYQLNGLDVMFPSIWDLFDS